MLNLKSGKHFTDTPTLTRGGFLKGILASGIAPSITLGALSLAGSANASVGRWMGMMRNVGARMAVGIRNDYVKNGLITYFDADNIDGNNIVELVGGELLPNIGNNHITKDSNGIRLTPYGSSFYKSTSSFADRIKVAIADNKSCEIELCITPISYVENSGVFCVRQDKESRIIQLFNQNNYFYGGGGYMSGYYLFNVDAVYGTSVLVRIVCGKNSAIISKNLGNSFAEIPRGYASITSRPVFSIGKVTESSSSNSIPDMIFHSFRAYDRHLDIHERQHNYSIDKERFNLP